MSKPQIRIAIRVPAETKNIFMSMCAERSINVSDLIRKMIDNWIIEQKKHYLKKS